MLTDPITLNGIDAVRNFYRVCERIDDSGSCDINPLFFAGVQFPFIFVSGIWTSHVGPYILAFDGYDEDLETEASA